MASDPLAPHLRIVSILDPALDPDKFTVERIMAYLDSYDEKLVADCFFDGVEPSWFCITPLKQVTLADEIDPIAGETRKLKVAFLHCCHRVENTAGATLFEVAAGEWTKGKSPKLATSAWWERAGDEYGSEVLYSIGVAVMQRARLPKSKRSPLR